MKCPTKLQTALEATGLPWSLEMGTKHIQVRLAGRLVGILPKNGSGADTASGRNTLNTVSKVRRLAAELKEQRA